MVTLGEPVRITYRNYRGETAQRVITPQRVWFGSTEWHPEPQWLMAAFDHEKQANRDFALKDFGYPAPSPRAQALEEAAKIADDFVRNNQGYDSPEAHAAFTVSSEIARYIRALSSQPVADDWLPIETAPNNKAILVHYDDGNIELIRADDNEYSWVAYTVKEEFCTKPTHWRPLPASPGASE